MTDESPEPVKKVIKSGETAAASTSPPLVLPHTNSKRELD